MVLARKVRHEFEKNIAVARVEVSGWLVGQDNGGPHQECASHGYALRLAAGEHRGPVIEPFREACIGQQFFRARTHFFE